MHPEVKRVAGVARAATGVSHLAPGRSARCRGFFRLARGSLSLLAMCSALAGCIVAGPPDYKDPTQTPPVLDLNGADPSILQIIERAPGEQITFKIKVRSEDAGDDLIALLYIDYGATTQALEANQTIAASTFDDTNREVNFAWTVPNIQRGCRQLTLLVTHTKHTSILGPTDNNDIALVTWFLNVADPDGTNVLAQCPKTAGGKP